MSFMISVFYHDQSVICLDEIKMNLLGKSCICPGFSTVICNLMISASPVRSANQSAWFKEYVSGCGQEIYCTTISKHLAGLAFSDAVVLLYREHGCLLYAIEIVDVKGVPLPSIFISMHSPLKFTPSLPHFLHTFAFSFPTCFCYRNRFLACGAESSSLHHPKDLAKDIPYCRRPGCC